MKGTPRVSETDSRLFFHHLSQSQISTEEIRAEGGVYLCSRVPKLHFYFPVFKQKNFFLVIFSLLCCFFFRCETLCYYKGVFEMYLRELNFSEWILLPC